MSGLLCVYLTIFTLGVNNGSQGKTEPFCIFAERRRRVPLFDWTCACCTARRERRGRGPTCVWFPAVSARSCTSNIRATAPAWTCHRVRSLSRNHNLPPTSTTGLLLASEDPWEYGNVII